MAEHPAAATSVLSHK